MNFTISILIVILYLSSMTLSSNRASSTVTLKFNESTSSNILNTLLNNSQKKLSTRRSSSTSKSNNKWKIGRVTNKQYGIINVLWQKTKVFIEEDYSNLTCKATTIEVTPEIQNHVATGYKSLKSNRKGKLLTTTSSNIEFYYLDQADDRIKRKHPGNIKLQKHKNNIKTNADQSKKLPIPSLFNIHINGDLHKHPPTPTESVYKVGQGIFYRTGLNKPKPTTFSSNVPLAVRTKSKLRNGKQPRNFMTQKPIFNKIVSVTTKANLRKAYTGRNNSHSKKNVVGTTFVTENLLMAASISTIYDKVKFFEMYDNNTPKWRNYNYNNLSNRIYINDKLERNNKHSDQILLQHVNVDIGHQHNKNKTRYVKKHIQDLYHKQEKTRNVLNTSKHFTKIYLSTSKFSHYENNFNNLSRPAIWSEFPFVAVYVYEPLQVRCDAAGISPHWLVAAASCLSRHSRGLRGGGLSAFVTFCSDNWRYSKLISYVKRTLIHPLYRPKDRSRYIYNAGLVQVVNSMADTCSGWAPVSLMSHQFTADEKGSIGTAVGWGLDRYDDSYTSTDIPRHPLMKYEGQVYSNSCPGNSDYSKGKSLNEVDINHVYCLPLPPYVGEENDTVHGALLLIGGKLLALYLKEERRPWGVQSAQYASMWRSLPWLGDTAREPEETFQIEI